MAAWASGHAVPHVSACVIRKQLMFSVHIYCDAPMTSRWPVVSLAFRTGFISYFTETFIAWELDSAASIYFAYKCRLLPKGWKEEGKMPSYTSHAGLHLLVRHQEQWHDGTCCENLISCSLFVTSHIIIPLVYILYDEIVYRIIYLYAYCVVIVL